MGYTWISGEPWGWMPYHYGSWNFSNGFGWFWMPGGSTAFSPALVSWYSGPGWIGWAPQGPLGLMGQNMITAAPGGVIRDGLLINPQTVRQVEATSGTVITRLPFEPGAGAMLSGRATRCGRGNVVHPACRGHSYLGARLAADGRRRGKGAIVAGHARVPPTFASASGNNLGWAICRGWRRGRVSRQCFQRNPWTPGNECASRPRILGQRRKGRTNPVAPWTTFL